MGPKRPPERKIKPEERSTRRFKEITEEPFSQAPRPSLIKVQSLRQPWVSRTRATTREESSRQSSAPYTGVGTGC